MAIHKTQIGSVHIFGFTGDQTTRIGDIAKGDYGSSGAHELSRAVEELNPGAGKVVLLDFSELESPGGQRGKIIDSSFVGEIVNQHVAMEKQGSVLGLWGVGEQLGGVLRVSILDTALNVLPGRKFLGESFETRHDAITKLLKLLAAREGPAPVQPGLLAQGAEILSPTTLLVQKM